MSLCLAANDPASAPLVVASLPAPSRDLASAAGRRRYASQAQVQAYPIGYFHIDIAEVRTEEGKLYLFVAIDRTAKFAFAALHEKSDRPTAARFLGDLISAVPYRVHILLTDNGLQFTDLPRIHNGQIARYRFHPFEEICRASGIEHRLTKPNHPWTNGQVERMNRTLKEATVKRYYYETHCQLRSHMADFVTAYNFGRRLKTLKGTSGASLTRIPYRGA